MQRVLSLTLLGGFGASLGGKPLPALAKKTQALVAYLAIEPAATHPRAHLATLLWGETGEEQALQSLRKALSVLRQTLGADADTILMIQERAIGLNRSAVSVDAVEFERLARADNLDSRSQAAALYRGHLLSGFDLDEASFNEWLLTRRERLRELALNALSRLLDRHVENGAIDPAIETASRLFELEPLHEPAHRALIQLHGRQGRRAAAARQYQLCVDALARELGVTPEPATEAAYREAISAGAADASLEAPTAVPSAPVLPGVYVRGRSRRLRLRHLAAAAVVLVAVTVGVAMLVLPRLATAPASSLSIAVLPLVNLSKDPSQDYLADGVTDALIHDLSQIKSLRVISRTSIMRFKQTTQPIGEIARALDVNLVMEGSVQQSGDRVRITLQLIEAASERQIFSRTFETDPAKLFDTQREIARHVAREVIGQITPAEQARLDRQIAVVPEAYRHYLLGRHQWNRRTVAALRSAAEFFQQAIAIDPTFARAQAALAETYVLLGDEEFAGMPTREASRLTQEAAAKALALDPHSAEAHAALGLAMFQFEWDWDRAEAELQQALAANPGYATAHGWYGWLQITRAHFDEAIESMERARALDPLSLTIGASTGDAYYFARRYQEALDRFDATLELDPNYPGAHVGRARTLTQMGRLAEAREIFEGALKVEFDARLVMGAAGIQAQMGDEAGARTRLNEIRKQLGFLPSVSRAQLYFSLGEDDAAFDALTAAVAERSSSLLYMLVAPRMEDLYGDTRFTALVHRVNPELARTLGNRLAR